VVEEPTGADAWRTIEYDGVRVDVPPAWRRSDMGGCEFAFEHWGPPGPPACGRDGGVAFYRSATFDPARGPGVRRTGTGSGRGAAWAGYAYAGDLAVYAADDDRRVVQRVLESAVGPGRR
jgi:hypothetical protein